MCQRIASFVRCWLLVVRGQLSQRQSTVVFSCNEPRITNNDHLVKLRSGQFQESLMEIKLAASEAGDCTCAHIAGQKNAFFTGVQVEGMATTVAQDGIHKALGMLLPQVRG